MSKNVSDVLNASIAKVREMVDANTVVGSPIVAGETTIIPVSKVHVGLASGGADMASKTAGLNASFGGGVGCGLSVSPVAFIVIQGERVRVIPVDEPAHSAAERVIEQLPTLVDKLTDIIASRKASDITDI